MSYYRDELAVVAENRDPIPFEEAVTQGTDGKIFVFVHPNVELSENSFRRLRALFPPAMIKKARSRWILLANDAKLIFLTTGEIEHNALRGIGKVVWVD